MEKVGDMELYSHEEMLDIVLGEKGTPRRDKYETDVEAFRIGVAIKTAREQKNLTQEQLGEMIGVKRSQVSRIENGSNLSFATLRRIFSALKVPVSLDVSGVGRVAIW